MVVNAFKSIINLNPKVNDGLKAKNDRMIIKDESEKNAGGNDCCIYEDDCCPIIAASRIQNIHDKHQSGQ
jgi:hypothetical protein